MFCDMHALKNYILFGVSLYILHFYWFFILILDLFSGGNMIYWFIYSTCSELFDESVRCKSLPIGMHAPLIFQCH